VIQITSSDYVGSQYSMVNGAVDSILGMKIVQLPTGTGLLNATGTVRDCIAFISERSGGDTAAGEMVRSGISLAVGFDFQMQARQLETKDLAWGLYNKMHMNAVRNEGKQVKIFQCQE